MAQLSPHWMDFHEILCLRIFPKSVKAVQIRINLIEKYSFSQTSTFQWFVSTGVSCLNTDFFLVCSGWIKSNGGSESKARERGRKEMRRKWVRQCVFEISGKGKKDVLIFMGFLLLFTDTNDGCRNCSVNMTWLNVAGRMTWLNQAGRMTWLNVAGRTWQQSSVVWSVVLT